MKHATIFDNSKYYVCGRTNYTQVDDLDLRISKSKPTFPAYNFRQYLTDKTACRHCINRLVKDNGL